MAGRHLDWSRRRFLGVGAGGGAFLALEGALGPVLGGLVTPGWRRTPFADDDLAGRIQNLVLRYRTDPERIARILPPGLEPDIEADVMLDWWLRHPVPGEENIFFPDVYGECGIHVTARYQGLRGMFQVGMPLDQDWGRSRGREDTGLVKKDGEVGIERTGDVVTADLRRRGKLLYRIRTRILDEPGHPLFWHRETGFGQFLYRYRLDPDWRNGPLDRNHPVELWSRVLAGRRGWYPEEMLVGGPRRCDPDETAFEFVDPSPLDPFVEFPMRGIVGISYDETGLAPEDARAYREAHAPGTQSRIERLQLVDPERFEPWALYNYDRPISDGRVWVPSRWPEGATALKLTEEELDRYRSRDALALDPVEILEVDLEIDARTHARLLPPGLQPGPEPRLRILGVRVERSDLSSEPFVELWLLARCLEGEARAWYAMSHIVGPGGDLVFGRETFGHPSKTGIVSWGSGERELEVVGQRLGREFVRFGGEPGRSGGDASEEAFRVVGLRMHPRYRRMTLHGFVERDPELELVSQPWQVELDQVRTIEPGSVRVELPDDPGPGVIGRPDPWYEFEGATVLGARAGKGSVRRGPGRAHGVKDGLEPFYRERFDGARTTGEATSGRVQHTFLVGG